MIEVVFNSSAKASMERAGGKKGISKDIVNIGFALDIGDISEEFVSPKRKQVFSNMSTSIDYKKKESEEFFKDQHNDMDKLLSAAKLGSPIRIWKSNTPSSACGFAFLCYKLRDIDLPISVVSLPDYLQTSKDIIVSYSNWGELAPKDFHRFLTYEKELNNIEKYIQTNLWEELKEENSKLRALVNGKLISVPEDFYDHIIRRNIPDGEFTVDELVAIILGKYQLGIGDGWYRLRIDKMIEEDSLYKFNGHEH